MTFRPETTDAIVEPIKRLAEINAEIKTLLAEVEVIVQKHNIPFTFYVEDTDHTFLPDGQTDGEGNSGWVSSSRYC